MARSLTRALWTAAALLSLSAGAAEAREGTPPCGARPDIALVNGRIHTMMNGDAIVDSVLIREGRIAAVGRIGAPGPCTDVIDLGGRTAIPGLIDNHVHYVRLENLPGYHLRALERAFDVASALATVRKRVAEIPPRSLITAIGGLEPTQFAEGRFPNLRELDSAAPDNPVYISADGFGPGQTNSAGRDLLREAGVTVADDGTVAANADTAKAFELLTAKMSPAEKRQALLDEQAFALSMGLTTLMDQSGSVPGVGYLDQASGYDPFLDIVRSGDLRIRVRLFFPALDQAGDHNKLLLRQLDTRWPNYGPSLAKVVGIGEWSVGMEEFAKPQMAPDSVEAVMTIARRGWPYHQHVIATDEIDRYLTAFEKAAAAGFDLGKLSWSLDHLNGMTKAQIARANALGIGLALHGWAYLPSRPLAGPPFRLILDNAKVPLGGGSDGARISTLNPWPMIYYMVTGRNNARKVINTGQQISRQEAIRLWTGPDQGFFSAERGLLGGIAPGRFGDVTVLDRDVFDPKAVSDEDIRTMSAVLTVVDGKVAYDSGVLRKRR